MQVDHLMIFDQVKRKIWAIAYADLRDRELALAYQQACDRVESLVERLQQPLDRQQILLSWQAPGQGQFRSTYTSNIDPAQFCANVQTAKAISRQGIFSRWCCPNACPRFMLEIPLPSTAPCA